MNEIVVEQTGKVGLITLSRPKALNALSLPMIQELLAAFRNWQDDPAVQIVAIRGTNKAGQPGTPESLFGHFCAGGDIRFFHTAATSRDHALRQSLDEFFTLEYTLNHLIHSYPKPVVAFMDGVVMGGGMGIGQGAATRIVTEHTKMAMPETNIGLFPDVGGGYFLSRCPGHIGEYLGLTGETIVAAQALAYGLADIELPAAQLPALWDRLASEPFTDAVQARSWLATNFIATSACVDCAPGEIDNYFSLPGVPEITRALESADTPWARKTAAVLRKRSPLMLHVTLEQIRRARHMTLADALRLERDLVHHCFVRPGGRPSETVEGIRALAVDKDYAPKWTPARIEDVTPDMVAAFFVSPWPKEAHPLRALV